MRGDNSQEKPFGVVALCWNKSQVKHPEDHFHQFLYFESLTLQTCKYYCKHRARS